VNESISISRHGKCSSFIDDLLNNTALLEKLDGWFIFDKDDDVYQLARSNLSDALKIKILPIKKLESMGALGSKTGFISVAQSANITIPPSVVIESPSELAAGLAKISMPILIKGERRGGGFMVRPLSSVNELDRDPIPQDWYPLVLQKKIDGEERGVEALFRDGHLVGWLYSQQIEIPKLYGPSVARKYLPTMADDATEALEKYAHTTQAHGFANCAFMYSYEEEKHYFFEADNRTNAWHHFGKMVELDWVDLMTSPAVDGKYPCKTGANIPKEGVRFRVRDREIEFAIYDRAYIRLISLLLRRPNDGISPFYRDKPLNRVQNFRFASVFIFVMMKSVFNKLPTPLREKLKKKGVTKRIFALLSQG
jgi:hypothetical protein